MKVFIDTSGLYAMLVADDAHHGEAAAAFRRFVEAAAQLWTTSYVLVETAALLQRRVGMAAVRAFAESIRPLLTVRWVTAADHHAGIQAAIAGGDAGPSLVDHVSFRTMRAQAIPTALAFDEHFRRAGFSTERV